MAKVKSTLLLWLTYYYYYYYYFILFIEEVDNGFVKFLFKVDLFIINLHHVTDVSKYFYSYIIKGILFSLYTTG